MVYTLADGTQMTRRQKVILTGGTDGALTDYQLKLAISHAAGMQNGFDDLRITQGDMQTLIDAWLEAKVDGTSADVWGEFPSTPANGDEQTKGYMYFGNAGAASVWDGHATFPEFFDDFEGSSLDTNKWDDVEITGSGYYSVADSCFKSNTGTTRNSVARLMGKDASMNLDNVIAEFRTKPITWTTHSRDRTPNIYGAEAFGTDEIGMFLSNSEVTRSYEYGDSWSEANLATGLSTDTWYIAQLIFKADGVMALLSDSREVLGTYEATGKAYTLNQFVWIGSRNEGRATDIEAWIDWILVRKYAANPPTYAFSSEEHQRRMPMMI